MRTDSPPPVDPRLRELLEQLELEPGPLVPEKTLREVALRVDAAWDTLANRALAEGSAHGVRHVRRTATTRLSWVGIAVVVLCVIGVTAIFSYRSGSKASPTHYQTAAGQVSRVVLRGGTIMTLAPATSVAVSKTAVDVDGEAYFDVASSSKAPFVVRTSNTVVQVLGTAFSVRRYANEARTRVVVEDGKVAVRAMRNGVVSENPTAMTARMMAQVSDSGVSVTPVSDTRTLTGWRDGMLVFTDVPVRDVVAEIARCYDANIRVEGKDLANETLILKVSLHRQSLSQVLYMVSLATNAHVRRDRDAYVLVPGRDVATPRERPQQPLPQPEKLYGR